MTRDKLLNRLLRLLPSQFEVVLLQTRIPQEYLSGNPAPQAARAVDAIRYLEQQNKLEQLGRTIDGVIADAWRSEQDNAADPR